MVTLGAHVVQFDWFVHVIGWFVKVFNLAVLEPEHVSGGHFGARFGEGNAVNREDCHYYSQCEGAEGDADK